MAIKLKSLLPGPQSPLVLRTAIFGVFLAFVKIGDFALAPILVFVSAALILYQPFVRGSSYRFSFGALILGVILSGSRIGNPVIFVIFFVASTTLFYLLLGLKEYLFIFRESWHYTYLLLIFFIFQILFFSSRVSENYILKIAGMFCLYLLLFQEFLKNHEKTDLLTAGDIKTRLILRQSWLFAGITAFLSVQSIWAISLLPFDNLAAANFSLSAVFVITDMVKRQYEGTLNRLAIFADLVIFTLLALAIFLITDWRL